MTFLTMVGGTVLLAAGVLWLDKRRFNRSPEAQKTREAMTVILAADPWQRQWDANRLDRVLSEDREVELLDELFGDPELPDTRTNLRTIGLLARKARRAEA